MTVNQAKNAPGPNNDNEPGRLKSTKRRMRKSPAGPAAIPALAGEDMPPQVRSEVMKLVDELDRLKDELVAANERVSELEDMADEDPLVPVLNRRGFERELERTLAYVKRYKTPVTLVYLDLDDFKGCERPLRPCRRRCRFEAFCAGLACQCAPFRPGRTHRRR